MNQAIRSYPGPVLQGPKRPELRLPESDVTTLKNQFDIARVWGLNLGAQVADYIAEAEDPPASRSEKLQCLQRIVVHPCGARILVTSHDNPFYGSSTVGLVQACRNLSCQLGWTPESPPTEIDQSSCHNLGPDVQPPGKFL
jgi:hypothetical protein